MRAGGGVARQGEERTASRRDVTTFDEGEEEKQESISGKERARASEGKRELGTELRGNGADEDEERVSAVNHRALGIGQDAKDCAQTATRQDETATHAGAPLRTRGPCASSRGGLTAARCGASSSL